MYVSGSASNNNVIILAYELPDSQIPAIDSSSRNGDFRIGYWGDSIDTINYYETAEYQGTAADNSGLVYNGTVSGYAANIVYYFDSSEKLYKGGYQITEQYSQGASYIAAYNTLKENLISKYGTPTSDLKRIFRVLLRILTKALHFNWAIPSIGVVGKLKHPISLLACSVKIMRLILF